MKLELIIAPTCNIIEIGKILHLQGVQGNSDLGIVGNFLGNKFYKHLYITFLSECDFQIYQFLHDFESVSMLRIEQAFPKYTQFMTSSIANWLSLCEEILNNDYIKELRVFFGKIFLLIEKALPEAVNYLHKMSNDDGTFYLKVKHNTDKRGGVG